MLFGYVRLSETNDSQAVDLQRDALLSAEVGPDQLCHNFA